MVRHVQSVTAPGLYTLARGRDREYLVCERCGRVTGVDPAALDGVRAQLRLAFGHQARFRHFPIHGHCADCARAVSAGETEDQTKTTSTTTGTDRRRA